MARQEAVFALDLADDKIEPGVVENMRGLAAGALPLRPDLSRQFLRVESGLSEKISLPTSQSRSTAR